MNRFKTIYVYAFLVVLFFLNLPQFSLKIANSEIVYPNIDLSLIIKDSTLGNFSKGSGLYSSKLFKSEVNLDSVDQNLKDSTLKDLLNVIYLRAYYANLYDLDIYASIEDSKYFINIVFPNYYTEADKINTALLAKGEVFFENDPSVSTNPINISDSDVQGLIKSNFNEQYGNVLEFRFNPQKQTDLNSALNNQNGYFLMRVDSSFFAVTAHPSFSNTQSADLANLVVAVPFSEIKQSSNVSIYNSIVKSYFLTPPLSLTINATSDFSLINRDLVLDRLSYIAILLLMAIAIVIIYVFYKNNFAIAFKYMLINLSFILLFIFLLKFQSASLSGLSLLTISIAICINFILTTKLVFNNGIIYIKEFIYFNLLTIILLFSFVRFIPISYFLNDVFGVWVIYSICSIVLLSFNYRYILNLEIKNLKIKVKKWKK